MEDSGGSGCCLLGWAKLANRLSQPGDHKRLALLDELHDPTPPAPSLTYTDDLFHFPLSQAVDKAGIQSDG